MGYFSKLLQSENSAGKTISKQMKSPSAFIREGTYIIRQQSIFPGRCQPSIVDASELNFCVRNGNRCGLTAITTGMVESLIPSGLQRKLISSRSENVEESSQIVS